MCPPPQVASEGQVAPVDPSKDARDRTSESSLLTAVIHKQLLHATRMAARISVVEGDAECLTSNRGLALWCSWLAPRRRWGLSRRCRTRTRSRTLATSG